MLRDVAIRFVCCYLALHALPLPPPVWSPIVGPVGRAVFGWNDVRTLTSGSGDTPAHWVQAFCLLVLAVVGTAVWTVVRRPEHAAAMRWVRILVRWSFGTAMISYGSFKVIQSQFPEPSFQRLLQPFGEASPMGLLWTFMGASRGYNLFTGGGEMLAGLLVFFPRTVTLGSLIGIGVMSHVVVLNFCYDVPVKLYSVHLLLMAVFLAAPDLGRLVRVLVLNRGAEPVAETPLFERRWANRLGLGLRYAALALAIGGSAWASHSQRKRIQEMRSVPAEAAGIWEVEDFDLDGKPLPPGVADGARWRRMILGGMPVVEIRTVVEGSPYRGSRVDGATKKIEVEGGDLGYRSTGADELTVEGTLDGHAVRARMKRRSKVLLIDRGFHWVTDYPFNR